MPRTEKITCPCTDFSDDAVFWLWDANFFAYDCVSACESPATSLVGKKMEKHGKTGEKMEVWLCDSANEG